jgi:hypothetical protein
MAMEIFGSELGIYAGIACVVSYMFSGYASIYRSQRVGTNKLKHVPENLKLADIPAYKLQKHQQTAQPHALDD